MTSTKSQKDALSEVKQYCRTHLRDTKIICAINDGFGKAIASFSRYGRIGSIGSRNLRNLSTGMETLANFRLLRRVYLREVVAMAKRAGFDEAIDIEGFWYEVIGD